jgi:hypothetical protein
MEGVVWKLIRGDAIADNKKQNELMQMTM